MVFVYILANKRYGTLYAGLTTNLMKRIEEHRQGLADGFTKQHGCTQLIYYEIHKDIDQAAHRERLLKKWKRQWKIELIEKSNPNWYDLYWNNYSHFQLCIILNSNDYSIVIEIPDEDPGHMDPALNAGLRKRGKEYGTVWL
ncbi:MAG: GIY-YIG nuclease family protein [Alphaproteobacteria bacterium]|nr:GIY-YIG nuclease family protein [Alphaproteobacteria bacterium]